MAGRTKDSVQKRQEFARIEGEIGYGSLSKAFGLYLEASWIVNVPRMRSKAGNLLRPGAREGVEVTPEMSVNIA